MAELLTGQVLFPGGDCILTKPIQLLIAADFNRLSFVLYQNCTDGFFCCQRVKSKLVTQLKGPVAGVAFSGEPSEIVRDKRA